MNCTPSRANPDSLKNVELLETGIQPVVFYIMNIDEGFFINDAIGSDLLRAFTSVLGISKIERVSPTKCQSLKRTCRLLWKTVRETFGLEEPKSGRTSH